MKQHPILFQDDMVRAILSGSKTQTRRIAKVATVPTKDPSKPFVTPLGTWTPRPIESHLAYYKYQTGDQLWIREAWRAAETECEWSKPHRPHAKPSALIQDDCSIFYRASAKYMKPKWRPSIFMPRWASRIQLAITNIRLEKLYDISDEDALAEGVIINPDGSFGDYLYGTSFDTPMHSYFSLWEKINGYANLQSNPWVWVTEFKRVEAPA